MTAAGLMLAGTSITHASHPFEGSGQLNINYLYHDLEPAGAGERITYSVCGPAEWRTGVENWDNAIQQWQFDEVTCGAMDWTTLQWEDANVFCPDAAAWACWDTAFLGQYPPHGLHRDINFDQQRILFDSNYWSDSCTLEPPCLPTPKYEWRVYVSAHEWGHNMGLADHSGTTDCLANSLMGNYTNLPPGTPIPDVPCFFGPSPTDQTSVLCNVYKFCAGVRVAAGDIFTGDGGCEEIVTAPGPGPDSWVRIWGPATGSCIGSSGVVLRAQFRAYAAGFQGGVYLAAGNIDPSTPADEVITGAGAGAGSHVIVWRINANGTATALYGGGFFAYPGFTGGVRVGAGDMDCVGGDDEIITAPGAGRLTEVLSFQGDGSQYTGGSSPIRASPAAASWPAEISSPAPAAARSPQAPTKAAARLPPPSWARPGAPTALGAPMTVATSVAFAWASLMSSRGVLTQNTKSLPAPGNQAVTSASLIPTARRSPAGISSPMGVSPEAFTSPAAT